MHFRPWAVTVAAIPATASSLVIRGRARQVRVMRQNSRCSILFHFDVPGGKWHTVISRPVSAARTASWSFQSRPVQLFEPPASQVTSSRRAPG
jgi:hypothetical protein